MTGQQLQAIKERVAAATVGEWKAESTVQGTYVIDTNGADLINWIALGIYEDNAQFIAHARQDVPALVAEVERLQKEVHAHEQSLLHDTYSEFTAKREIEQLRKALEFYADEKNYIEEHKDPFGADKYDSNVTVDEGEIARKALEGGENVALRQVDMQKQDEIEQLREALTAVNSTIGTYLKAYHYPVYEQMARALEGADDTCI